MTGAFLQGGSAANALQPAAGSTALVALSLGDLLADVVTHGLEASPGERNVLMDALAVVRDQLGVPIEALRAAPQLGTSHAAVVLAPFSRDVATDQQGLLTQLTQLQASLTDAIDRITASMHRYRDADESGAGSLRSSQRAN